VLTAWGRTERCATVNETVVRDFYAKHVNAPLAPEAGAGPISGADSYPAGTLPQASPASSPTPSTSTTKK
jgi:hypothetical protein